MEKAYYEANPQMLTRRIQLHPTYIAVPEWERKQADTLVAIRTRNYRFDPLFLGAVTTGELGEWCAFYYFRVYGESRTIAEGLLATPKREALASRDLVVHVKDADGKPCAGAMVNLENGPYVFLRSEECSDTGTTRIGHVPAYVRDGINYMVMYDEKVFPNVAPEILAPTEVEAVEVVLTLE